MIRPFLFAPPPSLAQQIPDHILHSVSPAQLSFLANGVVFGGKVKSCTANSPNAIVSTASTALRRGKPTASERSKQFFQPLGLFVRRAGECAWDSVSGGVYSLVEMRW